MYKSHFNVDVDDGDDDDDDGWNVAVDGGGTGDAVNASVARAVNREGHNMADTIVNINIFVSDNRSHIDMSEYGTPTLFFLPR